MGYLGIVVTFCAALLGVFGNTYTKKKITRNGWIGICLAIFGLFLAIHSEYRSNDEKVQAVAREKEATEKLDKALVQLSEADKQRAQLNAQLDTTNTELSERNGQLDKAEKERKTLLSELKETKENVSASANELNQTREDLRQANLSIAQLTDQQDAENSKRAEFENRHSRARNIIEFMLTCACEGDYYVDTCAGIHKSWCGGEMTTSMSKGNTPYEALQEIFSRTSGDVQGVLARYGADNTNRYASEIESR